MQTLSSLLLQLQESQDQIGCDGRYGSMNSALDPAAMRIFRHCEDLESSKLYTISNMIVAQRGSVDWFLWVNKHLSILLKCLFFLCFVVHIDRDAVCLLFLYLSVSLSSFPLPATPLPVSSLFFPLLL